MRKYELMTIYPLEEDKYKAGLEALKADLANFGAEIEKEEPYGDRDLTYEVKRQKICSSYNQGKSCKDRRNGRTV